MGALTGSPQWVASWSGMCHTWDKQLCTSEKETFWGSLSWMRGSGRHPPRPWVAGVNEHAFLPTHYAMVAATSHSGVGVLCYPSAPSPFSLIQHHDQVTDRAAKAEFPVIRRRSRLGEIPQACQWNGGLAVYFPELGFGTEEPKACPWSLTQCPAQR